MIRQITNFLIHLRLHYQFFILSGGYLLGGLLADQMNTAEYWLQFLNVHVLLFGGATAFNSWWDKDEGPIGGLKKPPKMNSWMRPVSLLMMFVGWVWSLQGGIAFAGFYGLSLSLFWLYSTPAARWKGDPLLSLVAIAVSTGINSVFLGFLAAGGAVNAAILLGSAGAGLILVSLYPVSQVYQANEDQQRGDLTFYLEYGMKGVKRFFTGSYLIGLILLSVGFYTIYQIPALVFLTVGFISFGILYSYVSGLKGEENEYQNVMKIKFFASLSFVLFLLAANAIRYEWIGKTFLTTYF